MANEFKLSFTAADIDERLRKVSQLAQDVEDLKNGGAGGVQSDWNQNDETAVDYVKNRPFYTGDLIETELLDVNAVLEENELDWEQGSDETIDGTNYLFGTQLPPIELVEGKTYSILINDNKYTATATLENIDGMSAIFFGDFDAYFEGDDNDVTYLVGLIPGYAIIIECKLPEPPTTCKIYESEQEIVKVDPKYLPEGGVGYTEVVEETTTETYDILQLMTDAGVEFSENTDETTGTTILFANLTEEQMPINIVEGMEYTTVINGVSYTSNAMDASATVGYPLAGFGDIEAFMAEDLTNFRYAIMRGAIPEQEVFYQIAVVPSALNLTEAPTELVVICNTINTTEIIHKIDSKYLPDVQPDWNENDSESKGYIANRPFYDNNILVEWDGTGESISTAIPLFKVSNTVITDNELIRKGVVTFSEGMVIPLSEIYDSAEITDEYVLFGEIFLIFIKKAPCAIEGITFPEAGIYFMKRNEVIYPVKFEAQGEIVKLDPKYLPEGGVGYTEVVEETTTETYDILQLMTDAGVEFIGIPDEATGVAMQVATLTEEQMPINIVADMEYTTVINGVSYTSNAMDVSATFGYPFVGFGDMEAIMTQDFTNFRYVIAKAIQPDTESYTYNIMLNPSALNLTEAPTELVVTSNTINTTEIIHQIDPKYLPEGGVGYTIGQDEVLVEQTVEGFVATPSSIYMAEDPFSLTLIEGQEYKITWDGVEYNLTCKLLDGLLYCGNENYVDIVPGGDVPFAVIIADDIVFLATESTEPSHDIKIILKGSEIHKIDPKYLPDQLSTPDWNENDETSSSYIKNRPFYEYKDCVYTGDVLLEEQTVVIDNEFVTISSELRFVAGKKYVVVLNGEQYTCVAWDADDDAILIGNGNIFGGEGMGEDVPFSCDSYSDGTCYLNVTEPGEYTITISELEIEEVVVVKKIDPKYLPTTELILKDMKTGYDYIIQIYDGNLITYRKFEKVEVTTPPNRIYYLPGDIFDPTGMVITGTYSDGTSVIVTSYSYPDAITEDNIVNFPIYCINGGVTVNISLLFSSLTDFDYIYSEDNSIILTGWNETYNGESSTELIIPEEKEGFTILL